MPCSPWPSRRRSIPADRRRIALARLWDLSVPPRESSSRRPSPSRTRWCGRTSPASRSGPDTPNRWSPDTATARFTPGGVTPIAVKRRWRFPAWSPASSPPRSRRSASPPTADTWPHPATGNESGSAPWTRGRTGSTCWTGLAPHHDEQINALIAWRGRDAAGVIDRSWSVAVTTPRSASGTSRRRRCGGHSRAGNRTAAAGAVPSRSSIGSSTRPTGGSTHRRRPPSSCSTGALARRGRRRGATVAASRANWRWAPEA